MKQLLEKILEKIKKAPSDYQAYEDLYFMCLEAMESDVELGVEVLKKLSLECERAIRESDDEKFLQKIFTNHKKVLLKLAPYDFDSYLIYTEWNRDPDKKFYLPRRRQLKQIVDALQELADDKLDLLAISLPPGSGKTTAFLPTSAC